MLHRNSLLGVGLSHGNRLEMQPNNWLIEHPFIEHSPMALIKCKECGEQISTKAVACPKCGAVTKQKTSGCALVFLVLLVFGFFIALSTNRSPDQASIPSQPTAPAAKPSTPNPAVAQSQTQITWESVDAVYNISSNATELQKNELWKKLKGKQVFWAGIVKEVSDDFIGPTLSVKMNKNTLTSDVMVRLKKTQRDKALSLPQGTVVSFSGILDQWGSILPITISDGEIL